MARADKRFYERGNNIVKIRLIDARLSTSNRKLTDFQKSMIMNEGCILKPYKDSLGYWTIGIGTRINYDQVRDYAKGITIVHALTLLDTRLEYFTKSAKRLYGEVFFESISITRQEVLIELCYNLGYKGLSSFKRMNIAIKNRDWHVASCELMFKKPYGPNTDYNSSKYVLQIKGRALEMAAKLSRGE